MSTLIFVIENCGVLCKGALVILLPLSLLTIIAWRRAGRLDLPPEIKKLFLMHWPKLLFGLGVVALLSGIAEFIHAIYCKYYCRTLIDTTGVEFWTGTFGNILIGGFIFAMTWFQYSLYLTLIRKRYGDH